MSKKSRPWSRQKRKAIRRRGALGIWKAACRPGGSFYEAYAKYYAQTMADADASADLWRSLDLKPDPNWTLADAVDTEEFGK